MHVYTQKYNIQCAGEMHIGPRGLLIWVHSYTHSVSDVEMNDVEYTRLFMNIHKWILRICTKHINNICYYNFFLLVHLGEFQPRHPNEINWTSKISLLAGF
jgi:hypothetical protein